MRSSTKKTIRNGPEFETVIPKVRHAKGNLRKFVAHTKRGWSPEEERDLETLAKDHTDEEIVEVLNKKYNTDRTYPSIVNKRQSLKIEKFARAKEGRKRVVTKPKREIPLARQSVIAKTGELNVNPRMLRRTTSKLTIELDGAGFSDYLNLLLQAQRKGIEVRAL